MGSSTFATGVSLSLALRGLGGAVVVEAPGAGAVVDDVVVDDFRTVCETVFEPPELHALTAMRTTGTRTKVRRIPSKVLTSSSLPLPSEP